MQLCGGSIRVCCCCAVWPPLLSHPAAVQCRQLLLLSQLPSHSADETLHPPVLTVMETVSQHGKVTHLDGVGEGQTDSSSSKLGPHEHGEDADSQHQNGTVQIAVECQPQVEGLSVEQGAVVLVDLVGSSSNEVVVLAEGSNDGQALQGLSNQADQVTCTQLTKQ